MTLRHMRLYIVLAAQCKLREDLRGIIISLEIIDCIIYLLRKDTCYTYQFIDLSLYQRRIIDLFIFKKIILAYVVVGHINYGNVFLYTDKSILTKVYNLTIGKERKYRPFQP